MPEKGIYTQSRVQTKTQFFNLDNGSGTTVDEPLVIAPTRSPIRIIRAYALYGEASQTVAAGTFQIGTTLGGSDLVLATAYENTKAVGTITEATVTLAVVPPATVIFVRHTGVASTQTGTATICVEFVYDE